MSEKEMMEQDTLLSSETERHSLSEDEESFKLKKQQVCHSADLLNSFSWRAIIVHFGIFLFYTVSISIVISTRKPWSTESPVAYTPFTPEPQAKTFQHGHSVYVGKPSPELDAAWKRLLKNSNVRITESEMSHVPGRKEQAIHLPDGGYFATPNVYHNLHCVKRLHHYMYPDHYFPNITEEQEAANRYHNHHCLDMIRQSLMCQGDMQLLTMKWRSDGRIPTANFTSPHQCINWDQLEGWAESRRIVKLMEPGYLNHPTLGPAYLVGHGDLIGEFATDSSDDNSAKGD